MRALFCSQVPKDPTYPDANEDWVQVDAQHDRAALSDGASESFDSRTWARILVSQFLERPELSQQWLDECLSKYAAHFDPSSLSWSKQASFNRGSFATLLGIEISPAEKTVRVISVGDSLCVLLDKGERINTHPYDQYEQFQQRPELFCTSAIGNSFFQKPDFDRRHARIFRLQAVSNPVLLCMTDALGEWALRMDAEGDQQWARLNSILDPKQLQEIVQEERAAKRMRIDDVTLLRIDPLGDESDDLPHS